MALPEHIVRNAMQDLSGSNELQTLRAFDEIDEEKIVDDDIESALNAALKLARRALAKSKAARVIDIAKRDRME